MSKFEIVSPEATTNLISNPSVEENTTGWTAVGGSIARSSSYQRFGVYSLAVTPASGVNDGAYYAITLNTATQYTLSVYVRGVATIPYRLRAYDVTAATDLAAQTFTGNGRWQRVELIFTTGANTSIRLYVEKNNSASTAAFYVDGAQCEAKGYATTFCDGDQEGCSWKGARHASASERSSQTHAGGRLIDPEDVGVKIGAVGGLGMPPVSHNIQEWAQRPGALYRSLKVRPRVISLDAFTQTQSEGALYNAVAAFHDLLKRDRIGPDSPVRLRYTATTDPVMIDAVYDAGLEGNAPVHFMHERFPFRLVAYDPYWYDEGESAAVFNSKTAITVRTVIARIDGEWSALGPPDAGGTYTDIRAIAVDSVRGYVYFGGNFLNFNNIAAADYIVRYRLADGTWSAMGSGLQTPVYALELAPDGTLYIGCVHKALGGAAGTEFVLKWDGNTFTDISPTTSISNPYGRALYLRRDGRLYAGINEWVTTANGEVRYREPAGTWTLLGTATATGGIANIYAITAGLNDWVWVGGEFAGVGGVSSLGIVYHDGSSWQASGVGVSTGGWVGALHAAPNGFVYAGGFFSTIDGKSASNIAFWNGKKFKPAGMGTNGAIGNIKGAGDGSVYVVGGFTTAGGLTLTDSAAIWTGVTWVPLEIDLPSTPLVTALAISSEGLFLGFNTAGTALVPATASVTNEGTAITWPLISIKRSGGTAATLTELANLTTGVQLKFYLSIMDGETITIDTRPGKRGITSDYRAALPQANLPLAGLSQFFLLPGANSISTYVLDSGSPTVTVTMRWRSAYVSVQGAN